jgi:Tat protein translocase TatB subunit
VFGNLGGFELLVLAAIALLVFGPRRLPSVGRSIARGLGDLRRVASEMKTAIEKEADLTEVKEVAGDLRRTLNQGATRLITDLEAEAQAVSKEVDGAEGHKGEPRGQAGS